MQDIQEMLLQALPEITGVADILQEQIPEPIMQRSCCANNAMQILESEKRNPAAGLYFL